MADLFQRINSERITLEDAKSKLVRFRNLLYLLENTIARKNIYLEKKAEVSKNAKSLFQGLKLIYSGFRNNIFGKHLKGN